MADIITKLQKVKQTKEAIKTAIQNKGGSVTDTTPFGEYPAIIETIETGTSTTDATATANDILLGKTAYVGEGKVEGTIETYDYEGVGGNEDRLKNFLEKRGVRYLFSHYTGTSVDELISYSDTENVTNMSYMFDNCTALQTIPLLNTSKVTNMVNMFNYCYSLQTIPLLNTSNVNEMSNMFYECSSLQTIPQLDTSNATYINNMFRKCIGIKKVDFTSWDKLTSTSATNLTFIDCKSLTKVIIRTMTVIPNLNSNVFTRAYHFTGEIDSTYNPDGLKDGRIYAPDNMVEQLKTATNWSVYADIIVPLSTLQEE